MTEEPSQLDKFKAAARELETDDDEARFKDRVGKLVKHKPVENPMNNDEERLADLRRKLAARDGQPGYRENVEELKAEIARLEGREPEAQDSLAELKRKLAAREGQPGYRENVEAIRAEIARLEAETVEKPAQS